MTKVLGQNWKTNLAALIAFLYSVPQFYSAVQAWQAHQKADWRTAIISLIVAGGLAMAKDSTTHSTATQVQVATNEAASK